MARPHAEPSSQPPPVEIPKDLLKPVIERIDHLTRRFEREQKALHGRLEDFEHNLTRLWELEEQMGLEEIRAQLAVMRANQEEIADGLHALARRPGHVKTREQLMNEGYPHDTFVSDRTIDSHIKRIRKKFVAVDPAFDGVETVYGLGYRYTEEPS